MPQFICYVNGSDFTRYYVRIWRPAEPDWRLTSNRENAAKLSEKQAESLATYCRGSGLDMHKERVA